MHTHKHTMTIVTVKMQWNTCIKPCNSWEDGCHSPNQKIPTLMFSAVFTWSHQCTIPAAIPNRPNPQNLIKVFFFLWTLSIIHLQYSTTKFCLTSILFIILSAHLCLSLFRFLTHSSPLWNMLHATSIIFLNLITHYYSSR